MSGERLADKVAFISGTGGGQGRAAALLFAAEGARVVGCDINQDGAQETLDLVRGDGGEMLSVHPLDVSTPEGGRKWIQAGIEMYGSVDVLYNNAASAPIAPIDEFGWEEWRYTMQHEADIVYAAISAAWQGLKTSRGTIINTSSAAALRGLPVERIGEPGSSVGHSAAKALVLGLTQQVAAEGARYGIRANAIVPGPVEVPATASVFADAGSGERVAASIPLGRIGQPEDIAKAALFLASDESSWITAETLIVDGGWTRIAMSITD